MKKGFSLVTLLVTIFVIIILTSTVVISANSIYNSNKKVKFASEISYIKELVNSYMVNNNGNLPSNSEVITSIRDISKDEMQSQFQDEDISNENTIVLNKIDMSMINPGTLQYGNGTEEKSDDIYCISKKTGRIYYARGCKIGSKTYYTLTDELKKAIKYTESNNINDGIIFCDGNLESGIKEIDVKVPESYLDIEITSSDASFEYSLEKESRYNIYKTKSKENSTITVKYKVNGDSEKKELKYNVEGVDNSGLTFSLSDVKKGINSSTQKEEKYVTIENISKEDSKIKIKRYANIYVNEEEAKNYFKNNGIEVKDNIVNIDNSLAGNITVYIEDKSGNYHIEYIRLSENNILDYVSNGLVLLLDGVKNTRNGHSTSTSIWEDLSGNNNDLTLENVVQNSNNMYFNGNDSKMYSEKALDVVSVEIVLELEEKNGYVYIASFGSNSKSMAWSAESDKGFSLGHMKKRYFVENLYKKNSISVQYNPDLMYLNSEKLTNNLAGESWSSPSSYPIAFGFYGNNAYRMKGKIYSIRLYNRALTQDEINRNYIVDKARFGIK